MERKYNIKLETVLDALLCEADTLGVSLDISGIHDGQEEGPDQEISVIIVNEDTNTIGIIGMNVTEFPDDEMCFFLFNARIYTYAKQEGFEKDEIYNAFDGKVLKKVPVQDFFTAILNT